MDAPPAYQQRRSVLPIRPFLFSLTVACTALVGRAQAQLVVLEPGFRVQTLSPSAGAKQIECSPGGLWGDYVYAADATGGLIERIDYDGNVSVFATGLSFPVGLAFGPGPTGAFGDFVYITNFGDSTVSKIDPLGVVTPFTSAPTPGANCFDPTGIYGNGMFLAAPAFSGSILTVDPLGSATVFAPLPSTYIKFGPGSDWGTGMFATENAINPGIYTVSSSGLPMALSTGFVTPEGFDWAFGGPWEDDMFATDAATGEIYRVKPDGTRSLWATVPSPADVAFCNGALYVVSGNGGCYRVTLRAKLETSAPPLGTVLGPTLFSISLARMFTGPGF